METNRTVVGVDTAQRVFQLHWVDWETGEIVDLKLGRAQFLKHFAARSPCVVAMEACGGSQHWAREMRKLGLAPRHTGTGGRIRMLGISKRGDKYLRTLLIHGARAVLTRSKTPPEWALRLAARRPPNVVAVALANKMARTIRALMAHDRTYRKNFVSQPT